MYLKPILTAGFAIAATSVLLAGPGFGFGQQLPLQKGEPIGADARIDMPAKGQNGPVQARLGERNPLIPPFVETFDDYPEGAEHDTFARYFEFINSNGDTNPSGSDRTWGFYNFSGEVNGREYSKCAYLQYPLNKPVCDDWLIPRAIKLEAGKYYRVTVDASLYTAGITHRFEVKMGEYNDAEGLATTVIAPVDVESIVPTQHEGWFVPEYDGIYYMGIHGISQKALSEGGYLFMDNIAMEAARNGNEPSQVTDIEFVSDPNGTPSVDIHFNAPVSAIDGSPLSGTLTIDVKRAGKTINTTTATPGQAVTVSDAVDAASLQTYTFTVSNDAGMGCDLKLTHFIGMSTPLPPTFTSVKEVDFGIVSLEWAAPETDINGTAINPESLTYNIYQVTTTGLQILNTSYTGNSITIDMGIWDGDQEALTFAISALINESVSDVTVSDVVFAGTPYQLPYRNSFVDNINADLILSTTADENVTWRMLDDYSDPQAQDGDGGYVGMIGNAPGQYGEISTGKIDFTASNNAYVSFYSYVYNEDENEVFVALVDNETGERIEVGNISLSQFDGVGWRRVFMPISGCEGKVMRLLIGAKIVSHGYILFDNLVIDNAADIDLAVEDVTYTKYASSGESYTVEATVANHGSKTVDEFETTLYCDNKAVVSKTAGPLAPNESVNIVLQGQFTATSSEMPTFTVGVEAQGEGNPDDNVSAPFNITFLAPIHPVVTTLQGTESEDGTVVLTWTEPDVNNAAPPETLEDFERYPAFTTTLNEFTMFDGDGGMPAGMEGMDMPVTGKEQAYWTMTSEAPYNFLYTMGNSSLFAMATVDENGRPIPNDDWLISPELYGGRQTINFWVCSQIITYGLEKFEVYASSTDTNISSFRKVLYETEVGEEWQNIFVSLPEGTKYFAIRCTSDDCMFFTIDNITYIATGIPRELQLKGYNVYRNGVRLNDSLLTQPGYTTSRELEGDEYFVTAVYDEGESTASNIVRFGVGGIDDIDADTANQPVEYYDLRGIRVSSSSLAPGIYLRRQGTTVTKLLVK